MQIYCPYLVINKTGLPFAVRPWRANRIGTSQDVAGDTRPGNLSYLVSRIGVDCVIETMVLPHPFSE